MEQSEVRGNAKTWTLGKKQDLNEQEAQVQKAVFGSWHQGLFTKGKALKDREELNESNWKKAEGQLRQALTAFEKLDKDVKRRLQAVGVDSKSDSLWAALDKDSSCNEGPRFDCQNVPDIGKPSFHEDFSAAMWRRCPCQLLGAEAGGWLRGIVEGFGASARWTRGWKKDRALSLRLAPIIMSCTAPVGPLLYTMVSLGLKDTTDVLAAPVKTEIANLDMALLLLALVAGNRSEGQDHLTKACDGEEPTPGWTVDFWARMRNSREELLLFSRRSSECAMEWRYVPRLPGFRITLGQQQHLSGSCDPLPEGEWTHLALRSTLDSLEVLVDGELAVTSQQSGLQVTLEADLGFGPADMEITEVRVWGAARSESELLQYQRQCLDTLLSSELRGEAWKRVKIRPAAEGPADSGVLPSLWDISALAQPGGQSRRKNEPQGDLAPASGQTFPPSAPEKEAPKPAWPAWGDFGDWRPFEVAPPVWPENSKQGMEESMESAKLPPSDIVEELPHLVPHKPHTKLPLSTPLLTVGRLMQGIAAKRSEDAAASTVTVEVLPAWQAQATPEVLVPGDPEIFSKSTAGRQDGSLDDSLQGSVRPLERTPASKQPPQLPDVLPPLPAGCSALHGADASVRIAASALNRQAYGFANALFKSVILQLGASGASVAMPALRSRFEAAVSYCCICHLLQLIQEGQEAISKADSSASTRNIQHALCQQWDCLLRLEKAPCHTVQLSLKAAAHLFSFTQAAGGWAAARRVSEVLLENYAPYLDSEQHSQVLYLAEATRHGLQAGRSSAAMLCACPGCGAPLDFLAKTCDTCSALLAVDFSELKLCDLRHASRCFLATPGAQPQEDKVKERNRCRRSIVCVAKLRLPELL
ncbi:Hypothetical protein SCF082_LOCUS42866 [Durusdinium trenchii]|uniref:Uncharacterized protein n=1 Tax=Durusdinium trenchii TaxID=1381693 RepID=A0ABP0QRM1_9DINO